MFADIATGVILQVVLGGAGVTGVIGAIVALYKLRPDVNSAAVVQAQGAMEIMAHLNDELKSELERRDLDAETCRAKIKEQEALITTMREMLQGAALWDETVPPKHKP
jgi:hypothetical protein